MFEYFNDSKLYSTIDTFVYNGKDYTTINGIVAPFIQDNTIEYLSNNLIETVSSTYYSDNTSQVDILTA